MLFVKTGKPMLNFRWKCKGPRITSHIGEKRFLLNVAKILAWLSCSIIVEMVNYLEIPKKKGLWPKTRQVTFGAK